MKKSGMVRNGRKSLRCIALCTTIFLTASSAYASATSLVSITKQSIQGNHYSLYPAISADGRYIAFESRATNFVQDDTNGYVDIFVADRITGDVKRVSVSSSGAQGNGDSSNAVISADGRYIAFGSYANNLVPGDTNNAPDIFVHDQTTGMTERVSNGTIPPTYKFTMTADGRYIAFTNRDWDLIIYDRLTGTSEFANVKNDGVKMKYGGIYPAMSSDGRFIAFQSTASDTDRYTDALFVRDRVNRTTQRVRVFSRYGDWYMGVWSLNISDDGRYLAFDSWDGAIVPDDTNGYTDVFVQDIITGTTERVSVSSSGVQGNSSSLRCSMSTDGRYIAFESSADNLITGDNNNSTDVFIHDRVTKITEVISISSNGVQGRYSSGLPAISADGRYIAFYSWSDNLVPCDTNGRQDIFVYDRSGAPTDYNGCGPRNNPPVANAGPDLTVECTGPTGSTITLDSSQSSDPDGDVLTYTWTGPFGIATGSTPIVIIPLGIHTVTLSVCDVKGETAQDEVVITVKDITPPTTTSVIAGKKGNNDWYSSAVSISFSATDSCLGVKEIHYSIGGGAETVVPGGSATFTISTDGTHNITYYAKDNAGNSETPHPLSINIDKTPSAVSLPPSLGMLWPPNHKMVDMVINGSATDSGSGVDSVVITVTDEYGVYNMTVPGFGSTIQLEAWREGTDKDGRHYTITAVVTDKAGNRSTAVTEALVPHDMR